MKLKQIVCDKTDLTLTKEKEIKVYGEEFVIEDEARAKEILAATYKGQPVAELVEETIKVVASAGVSAEELAEQMKPTTKKATTKKKNK